MRSRDSKIKTGRTIGEKREQLETANERAASREKEKRKKKIRVVLTVLFFIVISGVAITLYFMFFGHNNREESVVEIDDSKEYVPTIEVIDEDSTAGGEITSRMNEYIYLAESDFKDLGYTSTKAIIPTNSIREVDFYLENYTGYIKMLIDRDSAVSVEDADRMLRYLASIGVSDFQYIDVRIEGRAFWK